MSYDFDTPLNRRGTYAVKFDIFDEDVIPLWVADLDFAVAEPVIAALKQRLEHPAFGYTMDIPELKSVLAERMQAHYNWVVTSDQIVLQPGVVSAFNAAIHMAGQPGDNVLMQAPVYPPFLMSPQQHGQEVNAVELTRVDKGQRIEYEIDFDTFEAAINERTKSFLFCSPHNPVGRVWRRDELQQMAEICERHDVIICSDEIHCDVVFNGQHHIPIAALDPAVSRRTITLMSPSKSFNLPALGFSFAIIQDDDLRQRYLETTRMVMPHVSVTGQIAALAAYGESQPWLDAALAYLETNRDIVSDFMEEHMPGIQYTHPEGTYLSWLDTRNFTAESDGPMTEWIDPHFLKTARVALNRGKLFGPGGDGFVRLNFGCSRDLLIEALERMRNALA